MVSGIYEEGSYSGGINNMETYRGGGLIILTL